MRSAPSIQLASLRSLGRDARDTLFMLAVIAWTIAPHLMRLSAWVTVLSVAVLLWRGALAIRQGALPGRWALATVLALAVVLTWRSEHTLLGKEAGVTLLVVLMALKTLELRARRDALVVFFLGFFLVLTQFLYSQSVATAVAMGLSVWGWLTALTLAHMPAGRPRLADAAALAGKAALVGTPVMVALFVLFPRLGPLWAMPGAGSRTGLSDNLQLGDVAKLANDDSIAFRIRFLGAVPPAEALYFRGPVLSDYDGVRWRADAFGPRAPDTAPKSGRTIYRYEMTLEPTRIVWLPMLEGTRHMPEATPPIVGMPDRPDTSGQWRLIRPTAERVRLLAEADLQGPPGDALRPIERRFLLSLPPGRHLRTRQWALTMKASLGTGGNDPRVLAQAILQYIRREPFEYTLEPGAYVDDPVDEFWLDRRQGFCEHYAASFVIVMRAMGVPARIVTGYQGSDFLPVDDFYAVRQSHAHAWAEFWQDGAGWIRADPTAAVAPERIRHSQALQPTPGFFGGAMDVVTPGLRARLRDWAESLDNRWNQWVLGYGRREQFDLMGKLGVESPDLLSLARALVGLVVGAGLIGALWAWFDGRRLGPWQRLRRRIAGEFSRLGVDTLPSDTFSTLASRLHARCGDTAAEAMAQLAWLDLHRYGRGGGHDVPGGWWPKFRSAIRRIDSRTSLPSVPGANSSHG